MIFETARFLLDGCPMVRSSRLILALPALAALGAAAAAACSSGSGGSGGDNVDQTKTQCRNIQDSVLGIAIDGGLDDAAVADAAPACVTGCPGVIPDSAVPDAAPCRARCLERAAIQGLSDPVLLGCSIGNTQITCSIRSVTAIGCDPVGP